MRVTLPYQTFREYHCTNSECAATLQTPDDDFSAGGKYLNEGWGHHFGRPLCREHLGGTA